MLASAEHVAKSVDKSAWAHIAQECASSDVLLVLGECWSDLAPLLQMDSKPESNSHSGLDSGARSCVDSASRVVCLHPIFDTRLASAQADRSRLLPEHLPEPLQWQYEIGAELGVAVLLLKGLESHLSSSQELPAFLYKFLAELDLGHIASESALAEEELDEIAEILGAAKRACIIVGASFLAHPHARLIMRTLRTIEQLVDIELRIIPLEYGSISSTMPTLDAFGALDSGAGLDSSAVAEILALLAEIQEANGAYVYCSLLPCAGFKAESISALDSRAESTSDSTKLDSTLPMLFASSGFLKLMRLAPDTQAHLCLDPTRESTIACRVVQAEHLQGALAVLDMAHLARKYPELATRYPFIKAHFQSTQSTLERL